MKNVSSILNLFLVIASLLEYLNMNITMKFCDFTEYIYFRTICFLNIPVQLNPPKHSTFELFNSADSPTLACHSYFDGWFGSQHYRSANQWTKAFYYFLCITKQITKVVPSDNQLGQSMTLVDYIEYLCC